VAELDECDRPLPPMRGTSEWSPGMTLRTLTASSAPAELTLSVADVAHVDERKRTITGVLVPGAGVVGNTSAGPTTFTGPSSVSWHAELRRVKLLREHQTSDSLGYAVELGWSSGQLVGTFYVPPTPEGDRALSDAESGIRDGLSVGVHGLVGNYDRDGVLVVTASTLREVSLVSVPAFDDSRVAAVASRKEPGMFTAAQLAALTAAGIDPANEAEARNYLNSLSASAPAPAAPAAQPSQLTASDVADELVERLRAGVITLDGPNGGPGADALNAGAQATGISLSAFTELVAAHQTGDVSASGQLRAALMDVVPADMPGAFRPAYLTELWEGASYVRRFIDAATVVRPLPKAMKIIGQRWSVKPEVDDYLGDKAAIPSNEPVLVDIPVDVKRLAGGHDVDRAFIDLGDPSWLASYFEAQTEDVKKKSDARAAQLVYAGGTPLVDDDASPTTFGTVLDATVEAVVAMASVGEAVDYVAMAPGLIREFLNVKTLDGLAYMGGSFQLSGNGGGQLGGLTFLTSIGLTGAQVVIGSKSASRWHEFATPIRVQAVNVANGGIDLGVFQYYAGYVRNPQAVRTSTIGA
jgi:HK97 family phage prohead protease